jgi:hypothetical protein
MADNDPQLQHVAPVSGHANLRLSEFWRDAQQAWFRATEAQFCLRNITDDEIKYSLPVDSPATGCLSRGGTPGRGQPSGGRLRAAQGRSHRLPCAVQLTAGRNARQDGATRQPPSL